MARVTIVLLILALAGCASPAPEAGNAPSSPAATAATAARPTIAPSMTAAATPTIPSSETATSAPTMTARPTATIRPTNTPPPTSTTVAPEAAGLEGTLLLYATVVDMRNSPNRPASVSTLDDYYAFRTWPPLPFLDPAVFDVFYGERERMNPIGLFFYNFRPHLSPDGRYVLLPGLTSYPDYGVEGTGTWLLDLEAGAARQLLPDGEIATWSPAGDAITYVDGDTLYTLSVAEGAEPKPIFQHDNLWSLYAHWSPDGQWIAAVSSVQHEPAGAERSDVTLTYWLVPAAGGPARELTVQEDFAMEYATYEMSWSPDGQYLLMRNEVFDLDGNQVSPERSGGLDWLPNDTRLLMNDRDGVRIVTIAGEKVARISDTFADEWEFSHDGRRLAYTQGEGDAQVTAVYDLERGESEVVYSGSGSPLRWSADDSQLLMGDYRDGRYRVIAVRAAPGGEVRTILENAELAEVVPYPVRP